MTMKTENLVTSLNARSFKALAAAFLSAASMALYGASEQPYTDEAFKAATGAGKAVLVEIHADWCPTCKAQSPILGKLTDEPAFSSITRFRVDFDQQKDVVKRFKARSQSTLLLFKGKAEVARSVGETDEGRLRAMLSKASPAAR